MSFLFLPLEGNLSGAQPWTSLLLRQGVLLCSLTNAESPQKSPALYFCHLVALPHHPFCWGHLLAYSRSFFRFHLGVATTFQDSSLAPPLLQQVLSILVTVFAIGPVHLCQCQQLPQTGLRAVTGVSLYPQCPAQGLLKEALNEPAWMMGGWVDAWMTCLLSVWV